MDDHSVDVYIAVIELVLVFVSSDDDGKRRVAEDLVHLAGSVGCGVEAGLEDEDALLYLYAHVAFAKGCDHVLGSLLTRTTEVRMASSWFFTQHAECWDHLTGAPELEHAIL